MLHPVGKLPAAVYWRRRVLVLLALVSVLGGGGWLAVSGIGRWRAHSATAAAATTTRPVPTPALEQVVPPPAGVRVAASTTTSGTPAPCTDDMIGVSVRAPVTAATGDKPALQLVITNTSTVPCVRALDQDLQEIVLLDATGTRVWGSNDCSPESSRDTRILAPAEAVSFSLVWDGLTSEPTCTVPRVPPAPGRYVLRGRLGTKISPDAPLTLG